MKHQIIVLFLLFCEMYDVPVRKLALRLVGKVGVCKASSLTSISRSTLWRWKRFGVDPKRRRYESKLFETCRSHLRACLAEHPTFATHEIAHALHGSHGYKVSTKTIRKFIKKLGYSRKRTRSRGTSKRDVSHLKREFQSRYVDFADAGRVIVSVDECAFSESLKPFYGYSPVGQPVVIATSGGWTHYSLLMAAFSDGRCASHLYKGSIDASRFQAFVTSLDLYSDDVLVLDNASILKSVKGPPTFLFTPPYTPEFNAIEMCFSTVKSRFRKLNGAVETRTDVPSMVEQSIAALDEEKIANCFRHTLCVVRCHDERALMST